MVAGDPGRGPEAPVEVGARSIAYADGIPAPIGKRPHDEVSPGVAVFMPSRARQQRGGGRRPALLLCSIDPSSRDPLGSDGAGSGPISRLA